MQVVSPAQVPTVAGGGKGCSAGGQGLSLESRVKVASGGAAAEAAGGRGSSGARPRAQRTPDVCDVHLRPPRRTGATGDGSSRWAAQAASGRGSRGSWLGSGPVEPRAGALDRAWDARGAQAARKCVQGAEMRRDASRRAARPWRRSLATHSLARGGSNHCCLVGPGQQDKGTERTLHRHKAWPGRAWRRGIEAICPYPGQSRRSPPIPPTLRRTRLQGGGARWLGGAPAWHQRAASQQNPGRVPGCWHWLLLAHATALINFRASRRRPAATAVPISLPAPRTRISLFASFNWTA